MKKQKAISAIAALALAVGLWHAQAQLPISRNTGIVQTAIVGSGGITGIGLPFTRQPAGRVTVTSVSGATINISESLTSGAFLRSSNPASVVVIQPKINGGGKLGKVYQLSTNGVNSLTTTVSVATGDIVAGDILEIIPEWTFATLFGTSANPSGLTSNSDATLADIVLISSGGALVQYFHNGSNWRRVTGSPANANNTSLGGLNGGCLVLKKGAGTLNFTHGGFLRHCTFIVDLPQNSSIVTYVNIDGTTLGKSNLRDPSNSASLVANSDATLADIVTLAEGSLVQYFHNTSNWRRVSGSPANQNTKSLPSHRAIIINKKSSGTYEWIVRQ